MSLAFPGTFSKSPLFWGFDERLHVTKADGCYLKLSDNKWYIDWVSGLGTNLLGYGNSEVTRQVSDEIARGGGSLSLPHKLEWEVAKKLAYLLSNNIPAWNGKSLKVRFAKTGTDVTTMAIRLARAVTERDKILTFRDGYHGWGSWSIGRTKPAWGITKRESEDIIDIPSSLGYIYSMMSPEIAAIIVEHPLEGFDRNFYLELRQVCDTYNCLLIMDEVVTGFREGLGGISGRLAISPDLVCLGKAMGNGYPISALVGYSEYMDWFGRIDPVFCSSTHWGESVGLAAANAVLGLLNDELLEHIEWIGSSLFIDLNSSLKVIGGGIRSLNTFKDENHRAYFIHGMRVRGILMNRPNFPTLSHNQSHVRKTVEAAEEIMKEYEEGGVQIPQKPRVLFSNR